MSEKEALEQLDSLIEAWNLKETDINQTDINAIKFMLKENQKLKEQLKQRDEVIDEAIRYIKRHDENYEAQQEELDILEILQKYKGDNNE